MEDIENREGTRRYDEAFFRMKRELFKNKVKVYKPSSLTVQDHIKEIASLKEFRPSKINAEKVKETLMGLFTQRGCTIKQLIIEQVGTGFQSFFRGSVRLIHNGKEKTIIL